MTIATRLAEVHARIERACAKVGRDPQSVALVAVSKTHPASAIREAYAAGQRRFGENYVQELVDKARELADLPDLSWHLIGHLQRNKARAIAELRATVETVDSIRLADELAKRAQRTLTVLAQVNVAREAQKTGCDPSELRALIDAIAARPQLRLEGLMTIAPYAADPEDARPVFAALRELAAQHGLRELSMGMSADLEVAVEEGATLVRVGTAIFGAR